MMQQIKQLFGVNNSATPQQSSSVAGSYQIIYKQALEECDYQRAYQILAWSLSESVKPLTIHQKQDLVKLFLHLKMYNKTIELFSSLEMNDVEDIEFILDQAESHLNLYQTDLADKLAKKAAKQFNKYSSSLQNNPDFQDRFNVLYDNIKLGKKVSEQKLRAEAEEYKGLTDRTPSDYFLIEGNEVFLIPTTWMVKWKEYTGYAQIFESTESMIDENTGTKSFAEQYPGPILIESLLEPKRQQTSTFLIDHKQESFHQNYQIKAGSAEGRDFIFATQDMADFFYQRYGGMRLKRLVILNPITNEQVVDLFYKRINFIPVPTMSPSQKKETLYSIYIPTFSTLSELNHKIKRCLQYQSGLIPGIWNRQYFKLSKLSKDLAKNYSSCFTVLQQKYNEPVIQLDVQENGLNEDSHVEDLETAPTDILIYELSASGQFKIKPAKKKEQKVEAEENQEEYKNSRNTDSTQNSSRIQSSAMVIESEGELSFPNGTIRHRPNDEKHMKQMRDKYNMRNLQGGFSGKKGLTGLQNLGNTCFMNSSLQCLSNVEELTTFLVNSEYVNDLNPNNPLGANGFLAVSYAYLMRDMWQGNDSSVSAHSLKKVVGKFAPQFYGYNQQDSQELLSYMLDGIHEDLNRIRKKPTVEAIDYSGGEDEKYSALFYENYRKRNDSVISDLMMGQFKSTLICPQCKQISVIFDPFLTLSVPVQQLPKVKTEEVQFYVVFKESKKLPLKTSLILRSDLTIADLTEIVAFNLKSNAQNFIVTDIFEFKLERIFSNTESVAVLKESRGPVFIFQIEQPQQEISDVIKQPIVMDEEQSPSETESCQTESSSISNDYILVEALMQSIPQKQLDMALFNVTNSHTTTSYSRLLQLRASSTIKDLYIQLYKIIRNPLKLYQQVNLSPKIPVNIDISNDSEIQILLENKEFEEITKLFGFTSINGEPLSITNSESQLISLVSSQRKRIQVKVFLSQEFEFKYMKLKSSEVQTMVIPYSTGNSNGEGLNLTNCIDAFVQKEKLEKGNEWYCNKCKEHVLASKQMEIYKTPKILIIHLKRFKSGNVKNFGKYFYESGGKKISDHIDFPIDNLDLSKYVIGDKTVPQIYDLFAVSQHYGGMGGGHYTACAQNFINKRWYNFNDSQVSPTTADQAVSSAAYVLFYRRKSS